jgi:hypothetical protein
MNEERDRHCEPTGRANARLMINSARQSRSQKFERLIVLALFACWIIGFGFIVWHSSQSPKNTRQNKSAHTTEQKSQKDITDERLADYTLLLAWFTGILAVSTIGLWIVSWRSGNKQSRDMEASLTVNRIAADAANRSAKAFMRAERAYLFIQIKSETASDIVSKYGFWEKSVSMFDDDIDTPSVGYSFRNFGRTAAILKEFSNHLVFATDFPNAAEYTIREGNPDELIVEPNGTSTILGCLLETTFTVGSAVDFQNRKASFWFYGYVKFDDAFGREHEWRWRFRYRRGDGRFRLVYYLEFPDETES